ncbi:MAG: putative endonuclease [Solirubrobacterales bacterium]|jgi:putative endonuclease|nr:putative endonuclease [Solirubrobacterales bacterium]
MVPPMTVTRLRTGRLAEARAAEHLASLGYEIVARNARTKYGELDLVALDRRALVFIEVKASRAGSKVGPERPVLWVTPRKQLQVRRLAAAWMAERREAGSALRYAEIRFDAVGVVLDRTDVVLEIDHIVGAF